MKINLEKILRQYDYKLPQELIAQEPASPRDGARLMVYHHAQVKKLGVVVCDRKSGIVKYDVFANLDKYLPPDAVLVFNETKVVPARFPLIKETGEQSLPAGRQAQALFLAARRGIVEVLCEKKLYPESVVVVPGTKLRFRIKGQKGGVYFLKPLFPISQMDAVLQKYGRTPLPPYIKNSPLSEKEKRKKYQTVFAAEGVSVAAPTASLHFTKRLLRKLRSRGIAAKFIRLDVGLGTFASLTPENIASGKLHEEHYGINGSVARFLNQAKKDGRPIIAVGTTALRTLESATDAKGKIKKFSGETNLFIREGYKFKFVDGLITNFHVPKSSLLMLVSALVGRKKVLELYAKAIRKKFRLFSFGDGMLIL